MENKLADVEMIFGLLDVCDKEPSRYSLRFPFSPRSGLVGATDGRMLVCLYTDCHITPTGRVPDLLVFEKKVAEHEQWKTFDDLIHVMQPCSECNSSRVVFDRAGSIITGGEPEDFYQKTTCNHCTYAIDGELFAVALFKKIVRLVAPTYFAVSENQLLLKSDIGFGILMSCKKAD